jgi:phospholipid/cholesterol/gamma-HCH transport system ATP-binding protein
MIEIRDLCKSFDGKKILDGVSIHVKKGRTIAIIGRSGCGKSVLLKLIVGLMSPDCGEIVVGGQDVTKLASRELDRIRLKFGMLFQSSALFDSLTVLENVGFGLIEHNRMSPGDVRERVRQKLALVGLEGIEDMRPSQLSGGMKKRVALARAICMEPEVILYDEPTTGLDPINADAINNLIVDLRYKLGITSIAVTHDMASAYKIADEIAMLYGGRIIEAGVPEQIKNTENPVVRQFITGAAAGPITVLSQDQWE